MMARLRGLMELPVRRLLPVLLVLTVLFLCARSYAAMEPAAGNGETAYAKGVAAFQAGDYTHALDAFLRARAAGYQEIGRAHV